METALCGLISVSVSLAGVSERAFVLVLTSPPLGLGRVGIISPAL